MEGYIILRSTGTCLVLSREEFSAEILYGAFLLHSRIMAWSTIKPGLEDSSSPLAGVLGSFYLSTTQQRILYLAIGLVSYLALVRWLRFQRCRNLHEKYRYTTRDSMSKMTNHDAWAIQKLILQMEFPFIVLKALQFALFRVCPNRI